MPEANCLFSISFRYNVYVHTVASLSPFHFHLSEKRFAVVYDSIYFASGCPSCRQVWVYATSRHCERIFASVAAFSADILSDALNLFFKASVFISKSSFPWRDPFLFFDRNVAGHAAAHYEASGHGYAVDVESGQRVWDYAAADFVTRLIQQGDTSDPSKVRAIGEGNVWSVDIN